MSRDQLSDDGTPAVDTDALGAWVAETAAKKGVSERELLDEILSSYWVLEELSDVVLNGDPTAEGSEHTSSRQEAPPEPTPRTAATDRREQPTDRQERSTDHQERPTDGGEQPSTKRNSTAEPEPSAESNRPTASTADDDLELSGIEQELGKLRTVINELASEQSLPTPESATPNAEHADPDASSSTDRDDEAGEFEEFTPADTESWAESRGVVAELDDELIEIRSRLSELEAELTDRLAEEADERAELEAWIETEFDNIEDVLQHLLSTTDNLEYRLGSAIESQREQLEPLQAAHAEQEQLQTLKNEAIEKGVDAADCDDCGETVDLGLLPEPYCPNCDQQFTGVTASSWWPFDTATLRTATARRSQTENAWGSAPPEESHAADRRSNQNDQPPAAPHNDQQERSELDGQQRTDGGFNWVDD